MKSSPINPIPYPTDLDWQSVGRQLRRWAYELGFQQLGIANTDLALAESHFQAWLEKNYHGDMQYMQRHGTKRSRPSELVPQTTRIISVRMDYLPDKAEHPQSVLENPKLGYVSRYALGRDYHKLIRARLKKLAHLIEQQVGPFGYRIFVDSAPVLEKPLAQMAGLGWVGKHTNLIHPKAGSWFFLGELYTDLPLPVDCAQDDHCGSCSACMEICPTDAIVAPYQLDARRCISYLTIELRGTIPEQYRSLIGNRIYGCDDCQLVCPWNRFANHSAETDFQPRHNLDASNLISLFEWTEDQFLKNTEGSAIRRIGYLCWLRNIAVAMGNGPATAESMSALRQKQHHPSEMVREHVLWAMNRLSAQ